MSEPGVGVQLIVFAGRQNQDLKGVLADVADVGYDAAEIGANFVDDLGAEAVKSVIEETGLSACGIHGGYANYADAEWVGRAIEFCRAIGCEYLLCSGVKDRESLEGYVASAEVFNEAGRRAADAGLTFCYHNHAWEFQQFGDQKGIHALAAATDPALVKLNIDVYWVHIGGESPAEFIERYHDRAGYYHFKDGSPGPNFIELGQGEVDLVAAARAAMRFDPKWIVCEQDRTQLDPKDSIARSLAYLRELGF
ncbi:MAG TPA: sugar phosphate isomerase/epimerase [Armatimonadota bacterium]|nr:sugar phosphate isomerase/epimerase [Armatimonadota bacterium]